MKIDFENESRRVFDCLSDVLFSALRACDCSSLLHHTLSEIVANMIFSYPLDIFMENNRLFFITFSCVSCFAILG